MTTKVGRFSVTQTIPKKGQANQILNNANKREQTRKMPTWFERASGYNKPQSEEVRKQMERNSKKYGEQKTKEIKKQIEENIKLREIINKIKKTKSKEDAKRLLKKWSDMVKTKKQLRTIANKIKTKKIHKAALNMGTKWKKTAQARTSRRTSKKIKNAMNIALRGFGNNTARSTVTGYGSRRTKKTLRKN